ITLPPDYKPNDKEEFMNPLQTEYFRKKLTDWREQLLNESNGTINTLKTSTVAAADATDRASVESNRALELRTRDRSRKLINKINEALSRIEDGSYGFCEMTSEPIGVRRLEARPIATLSIEAQEMHERAERQFRDD
ncbi:MAG: RNA polymerase-binding protein DksA, partial [Rhodospirillales bacterium]